MSFQTSESTKEIYSALAAAQMEFGTVVRNRKVTVKTKTGGSYTYYYATLDTINAACLPALNKHGISVIQPHLIQDSRVIVTTRLCHASGEYIESSVSWSGQESLQELGSVMTYLRRYSLSGLLGIAAQTDEDGGPPVERDRIAKQAPAASPQPKKIDPVVRSRLTDLKKEWSVANPEYKALTADERRSRFVDWVSQVLGAGAWGKDESWSMENVESALSALHKEPAEGIAEGPSEEIETVEEVAEEAQ